jgi:septal ring factor EnvC (AmiA/AmiB activator)
MKFLNEINMDVKEEHAQLIADRDEAYRHILTLKARIRKALKLIEQAPQTEMEKSDKDVLEQISQVFADYGESNKRTVLVEFDRPEQAARFMQEFRFHLAEEYNEAYEYARVQGNLGGLVEKFYYDERNLIMTGK